MKDTTIGIVGYGRFARTLIRLLRGRARVVILSRSQHKKKSHTFYLDAQEFYQAAQTVFYCVPISAFETVLKCHAKYIRDDHVLIDVLSVKTHPKRVFEQVLRGKKTQALLTHPMFGPDSSRDGFDGLPIILDQFLASEQTYNGWKKFFISAGLRIIEMSADEHDRQAANSQGLTHFLGRLLQEFDFSPTEIDSLGATKLQEIMDQVCNDTWELYRDLQTYNPYTQKMANQLDASMKALQVKTFKKK